MENYYYRKLDLAKLTQCVDSRAPSQHDESLRKIVHIVNSLFATVQHIVPEIPEITLQWAKSKTVGKPTWRPLAALQTPASWHSYVRLWRRFFSYLYRAMTIQVPQTTTTQAKCRHMLNLCWYECDTLKDQAFRWHALFGNCVLHSNDTLQTATEGFLRAILSQR